MSDSEADLDLPGTPVDWEELNNSSLSTPTPVRRSVYGRRAAGSRGQAAAVEAVMRSRDQLGDGLPDPPSDEEMAGLAKMVEEAALLEDRSAAVRHVRLPVVTVKS